MASVLIGCGGGGGSDGNRSAVTSPDPPPAIRIASATVPESDRGTVEALFHVSLSHDPADTVRVRWRTVDDTATAGEDYRADSGTLVFGPDVREEVIDIDVLGDTLDESDEDFAVVLSDAEGATIEDGRARGRIEDDDAAPVVDSSRGNDGDENDGKKKAKKKRVDPSGDDDDGPEDSD
jgi:chitinase